MVLYYFLYWNGLNIIRISGRWRKKNYWWSILTSLRAKNLLWKNYSNRAKIIRKKSKNQWNFEELNWKCKLKKLRVK